MLQTVVHETGHNLGMQHDFNYNRRGRKIARKDSNDESCTDISAFMDYVFPPYTSYNPMPNKWSRCSWQDFIYHYQQIVEHDGEYCLAKKSDEMTACKNIRPAYMVNEDYYHLSQFVDDVDWNAMCEHSKGRCNIDWLARHCKKTCGLC